MKKAVTKGVFCNMAKNENAAGKAREELPAAVILAGGKGMRLRPLTAHTPKPLLPVGNKPAILRILENLEEEGVKKALILTGYKGEMIEKEIGGRVGRTEIVYLHENDPSGSAGSLKRAENLLEEEFFVLCGDAYGRRDFRAFFDFFSEKRCDAAMLLCRVREPGEYGIVRTNGEGRVVGFEEKPFWSQVFSDRANTGIYLFHKNVLSLIPPDRPFDVGGDLLPALLASGASIYGYEDEGVWRDIGEFKTYLACNLAENNGKSLIGKNVLLCEGARVKDSMIFDGVRVGEGSVIDGAIIDENCVIGKNCVLRSGCVLGRGCVLRDGAVLSSGTVLSAEDGREGVSPETLKSLFSETVLNISAPPFPDFFASLGSAAGELFGVGAPIGVFYDEAPQAEDCARAILGGICQSAQGCDMGRAHEAMAGVLTRAAGLRFSFFVFRSAAGGLRAALFDENGLPPGSSVLRALRDRVPNASRAKPSFGSFVPVRRSTEAEALYEKVLKDACFSDLSGMSVGVGFGSFAEAKLARALLKRRAVVCRKDEGAVRARISPDGRRAELTDDTGTLDHWHLAALLIGREIRLGKTIGALPYRAPAALFALASGMGQFPAGFAMTPTGSGINDLRAQGARLTFLFDGCAAAMGGLSFLAQKKTCAELLSLLPQFCVLESAVDCEEDEKLYCLTRGEYEPAGEGVRRMSGKKSVLRRAKERRGMLLTVEAANETDARELLKKAREELKRELEEKRENT